MRVGINGLGRIGRIILRQLIEHPNIEIVAINDVMPTKTLAYLLKYDSIHGIWNKQFQIDGDELIVDNKRIKIFSHKQPQDIPWASANVDTVIESSGFFKTYKQLSQHINAGAKRVVLSCPQEEQLDRMVIYKINHEQLTAKDIIISNASCTSNSLAPALQTLQDYFGIDKAFINTIHPFTNNQQILDGPHSDLRRARGLSDNIIPTTSTAIAAIHNVMPYLKDRLDGLATRVPVKDGALIEITALLSSSTTIEDVNKAFLNKSLGDYSEIMEYSEDPLVSTDIIGNPHSCIFDSLSTKVLGGNMVQIIVWYDNEYSYSSRCVDLLNYISKQNL